MLSYEYIGQKFLLPATTSNDSFTAVYVNAA